MKITGTRPMSAGGFSSQEYEEAKRRVQRLSAAASDSYSHHVQALPSVGSGTSLLPPPGEATRSRVRPASAPRARGGGRGALLPARDGGREAWVSGREAWVSGREAQPRTTIPVAPSAQHAAENEDVNKQQRPAASRPAGEGGRAASFMDTLQRNIMDLKECISLRLESSPQMKKVLDADFKELTLHLDRLIIHSHTERDRHTGELVALRKSHAEELAAVRSEHADQLEQAGAEQEAAVREARREAQRERQQAEQEHIKREDALRRAMEEQEAAHQTQLRQLSDAFKANERELRREVEEESGRRAEEVAEHERSRHRRQIDEAEQDKRRALEELAAELIPRIEAEMLEAHSKEVARYQRKNKELRKQLEAHAKTAELQSRAYDERAAEVEARGAAAEEAERRREEEAQEQSAVLARALHDLDTLARSNQHHLHRATQAVAVRLREREEAAQDARRGREEAEAALALLKSDQMAELTEINVRVRRVVETKERERAELAKQLQTTQLKLEETEQVLLAQQREVEALSGELSRDNVHLER